MDINNLNPKEIVNNNINYPISNGETNNIEKNILEKNEDKNISSEPKIKLKKKVNKLKMPSESNNIQNEQVPIPNIDIKVLNNDILNDIDNKNIEIKIEENNGKEENNNNKGYLDDDLEDEDNKKLYLRVIKRMEKTYGVPVVSSKIQGEPIEDIGLEENIRPILIGKCDINKKDIIKNNYVDNKFKNNINKVINNDLKNKENTNNNINNNSYNIPNNRINNHLNNNYYKEKRQYINHPIYNINNLIYSQNLNYNSYINYRPKEYLNNPGSSNKNIYNNDFMKKYRYSTGKSFNNNNPGIHSNKVINNPRKHSYEKIDKNFQKRLNKRYPIYDPNRVDIGSHKFNYKNLKYYNLGNNFSNFANLRNLNQYKYNYPLKKTYYISYNNKNISNQNYSNSKPNKYKNYFNFHLLNNTKSPVIPKTNFKYFKDNKNNKNYNFSYPLYNNKIYMNKKNKNNLHLNKSQNIYRNRNTLYNYTGNLNKYDYGRNNRNILSLTQEIIGGSNKKFNMSPFHSFNNYNLNFNYANEDNINNDYYSEIQMPKKEIKFTYYINSRYN